MHAGNALAARLNIADHKCHGFPNICEPVSESVVRVAWWRRLVDRYINHQIGICLHFHSWNEPGGFEGGDLAFVFQKAIGIDPDRFEGHSARKANPGVGLRTPRADNMKLPVPVLSRPIVENPQITVKVRMYNSLGSFGVLYGCINSIKSRHF